MSKLIKIFFKGFLGFFKVALVFAVMSLIIALIAYVFFLLGLSKFYVFLLTWIISGGILYGGLEVYHYLKFPSLYDTK